MILLKLLVSLISLLVVLILTRSNSKPTIFNRKNIEDWFMIAIVLVPLNVEMWR
jgi:hypothetical protein